ncbi:MAG: hypothetical protein Q9218_004137 [Villophora microphyllina]
MTLYNIALLSLLASTVSAVPHYGQYNHHHPVHHKSGTLPTGGSSAFPTAGPTAPYGQGNSTTIAPSGSAPVFSSGVLTSVVTVVPQPASSGSGDSPVESSSGSGNSPIGSSAASGECGPATVTVTSANTVTVTVGGGPSSSLPVESQIPTTSAPFGNGTTTSFIVTGTAPVVTSSSIPESSSVPESSLPVIGTSTAPIVTSSSIPESSLPVVPIPTYPSKSIASPVPMAPSSTNENSPEQVTTSQAGGQVYEQSQTTSAASTPESSTSVYSPEQATTSSSVPKTTSHPSSTDNVVPRGLVYNEASLTSHFDTSAIGWQYNWDSAPGGTIDTSKEFVPMLWNTSEVYHVPHWQERAEAAIAAGTKHLLAFNEPDLSAQANMDVGESVQGWNDHLEPFHIKYNGDVKLGSPSVCNGPDANQGLQYLKSFLDACGGCHIDFLAIHWYGLATDDGVQDLKDHIGKAQAIAGGRAIWLTEFQPQGSDDDQAKFLGQILPWLDDKAQSGVDRYAYFKVDTMVNGNSLTKAGQAYAA